MLQIAQAHIAGFCDGSHRNGNTTLSIKKRNRSFQYLLFRVYAKRLSLANTRTPRKVTLKIKNII